MNVRRRERSARLLTALCVAGGLVVGSSASTMAVGPNMAAQWNKIAEDTVVGSGAQQIEGFIYLSYTQLAVYNAAVAVLGEYAPYGTAIAAPAGGSQVSVLPRGTPARPVVPFSTRSRCGGAGGVSTISSTCAADAASADLPAAGFDRGDISSRTRITSGSR